MKISAAPVSKMIEIMSQTSSFKQTQSGYIRSARLRALARIIFAKCPELIKGTNLEESSDATYIFGPNAVAIR